MIFNANVPKEQEVDEIVYEELSNLNHRLEELEDEKRDLESEVSILRDMVEELMSNV